MIAAADAVIDGGCTGVQEANVPDVLYGSNAPSTPRRQAKRRRLETEFLPLCDHPACAQFAEPYNASNVCLIGELRKKTDGGNSTAPAVFNVIAGTGTTKIGCAELDWRKVLANYLEHQEEEPRSRNNKTQKGFLQFARENCNVSFKNDPNHPAFVLWQSVSKRKKRISGSVSGSGSASSSSSPTKSQNVNSPRRRNIDLPKAFRIPGTQLVVVRRTRHKHVSVVSVNRATGNGGHCSEYHELQERMLQILAGCGCAGALTKKAEITANEILSCALLPS